MRRQWLRDSRALLLLSVGWLGIALMAVAQTQNKTAPQPADDTARFEVASVRPADCSEPSFNFGGDLFQISHYPLGTLISMAYGVRGDRILEKPNWLNSECFTISAKLASGTATLEDEKGNTNFVLRGVKVPLQKLLAERFRLSVHFTQRDAPGYALVIAKGGPKLREATDFTSHGSRTPDGMRFPSVSTKSLAEALTGLAGGPVVDKTGLTGIYDIRLNFAPEGVTDSPLPSVFTAVQEQLGLKLEPTKVPVQMLVIDHVEKVPTEN